MINRRKVSKEIVTPGIIGAKAFPGLFLSTSIIKLTNNKMNETAISKILNGTERKLKKSQKRLNRLPIV